FVPSCSLCLSRSAPRRDLHSFPTRRSSDLAGRFARLHRRRGQGPGPAQGAGGRSVYPGPLAGDDAAMGGFLLQSADSVFPDQLRSEEHTSELQSRENLVCRLLLEKKKTNYI